MTREEVVNILTSAGLPLSYRFFPIGNAPEYPPYLLYFYEGNDDVFADDSNYVDIKNLVVELYTDGEREFDTEGSVDAILKANNLTYSKSEEYLTEINMYRTTYEMEVIING